MVDERLKRNTKSQKAPLTSMFDFPVIDLSGNHGERPLKKR